jgi:deoxyribonuclease-4
MPKPGWSKLLFGTAGAPHSSRRADTVSGVERVRELGLGCMEVEFVRGVRMGPATQEAVSETSRYLGIALSAHAPYYINLNSDEDAKVKASEERILQTARVGSGCSATTAVFHAATYMGGSPQRAHAAVKRSLRRITGVLADEGVDVWLRPEVMGRQSQYGSLEEVIRLSQEVEGVLPCLDLSHLHARSRGGYNDLRELRRALDMLEDGLGRMWLDDAHIHLQGVEYSDKGERRHLDLKESDMNYRDALRALKEYKVKGLLICESPNLEEDALLLKRSYAQVR